MAMVICDISALEIYRANRFHRFAPPLKARDAAKIFSELMDPPNRRELRSLDLARFGVATDGHPVHVLVASSKMKRPSREAVFHVWSSSATTSMLVELDRDVYLVSPEMLFLQMATTLDCELLAELGMEFCGCYEVGVYAIRRSVRPQPLTTVTRLRVFLEARRGEYGTAKALKALDYIIANSWSPMETKTCLLLCLPRTMGGYGLSKPTMNEEIKLPPCMQMVDGRCSVVLDMYWKNLSFAVEYDGEEDHLNRMGIIRDNRKKALLTSMGIDCISLTSSDVFFADAMDQVAARIAQKLGVRQTKPTASMLKKRIELRKKLLFSE